MPVRTVPVRNPRTGEIDHEIAAADAAGVAEAASRLRSNQAAWRDLGVEGRVDVMKRWLAEFSKQAAAFGELEAIDTGGTHTSYAQGYITMANVQGWIEDAAEALRDAAGGARASATMPSVSVTAQLVPYPLTGIISPWNAPTMLALLDAIPALFAGSAVLWKPSEVTPRFVPTFFETVRAVPELAAVFDYVLGDAATGEALVQQADVVCFTGSVETGRKVAVACAQRLIPAYLELGGKDPAIVTASADLDRATTAILYGATYATGQVCYSTERIYVDRSVHDDFVDLLVTKAQQVRLSYDNPKAGHLAPFTFGPQAEAVMGHLDDAVAKGAQVLTGGKVEIHAGGKYMRPTVVTGVDHTMQIMRDETFGPIMPVMAYDDIAEAIALANDTEYGLTASVLAGTAEEATGIGEQLNAGSIFLQDTFLTFGKARTIGTHAFGNSGVGGGRTGKDSILRFVRKKALMLQNGEPTSILDNWYEERD